MTVAAPEPWLTTAVAPTACRQPGWIPIFRFTTQARGTACGSTTGAEPDWPDVLDPQTGLFTYYGDNRRPGHDLHDTRRFGNVLLRDCLGWSHESTEARRSVPPFLLFEKAVPGRRIIFRGLLAPGGLGLSSDDELQAIWRSTGGRRFQNYRARFTVLDVPRVKRAWLTDILSGEAITSPECPSAWTSWVEGRKYTPMLAPSTTVIRNRAEQLPADSVGKAILATIRETFRVVSMTLNAAPLSCGG